MFKVSKWIAAGKIIEYHKEQYSSSKEAAYHSESGKVVGSFHGRLADEFGILDKPASELIVSRLAHGQHPLSGEQLVKHRPPPIKVPWGSTSEEWAAWVAERFETATELRGIGIAEPAWKHAPHQKEESTEPKLRVAVYTDHQRELLDVVEAATKYFEDRLQSDAGAEARTYLDSRFINDFTRAEFRLGISARGAELTNHLRDKYSDALLIEAGVSTIDRRTGQLRDFFQNRLMFPIQDEGGQVIAFGGRKLDDSKFGPKYLNSKNSEIYQKSNSLYNIHRASGAVREANGLLYTTEGYFDTIQLHQQGIRNVAPLSGVSVAGLSRMKEFASHIVANLDPDKAGKEATDRLMERALKEGVSLRAVTLDRDPDEFVLANGADAYRLAMQNAKPLTQWLIERGLAESKETEQAYRVIDSIRYARSRLQAAAPELREALAAELQKYLGLEAKGEKDANYTEHRAAVDMIFAPSKSLSVQALVPGILDGEVVPGDERIVLLHDRAVTKALDAMEIFMQSRQADGPAKTTGNWVVARFRHDVSRPLEDFSKLEPEMVAKIGKMNEYVRSKMFWPAADASVSPGPQLHTHCTAFNMTRNGEQVTSAEIAWIMRAQTYGNAIYMSEMQNGVRELGYTMVRGKGFAAEIEGYTQEYLDMMSLRAIDIEAVKKEKFDQGSNPHCPNLGQ